MARYAVKLQYTGTSTKKTRSEFAYLVEPWAVGQTVTIDGEAWTVSARSSEGRTGADGLLITPIYILTQDP